jgi:peptidase E
MSAFITIVQDFLYFGIGVGAVIAGVSIFADAYGRKAKKDEYLSELETLERIHASKKVAEATKEPEEKKQ